MAVTFSITRTTTRFHDSNGNGVKDANETGLDFGEVGVYDPGDILYTRINITNTGNEPATGVTVADSFSGSTFVDAGNGNPGTTFINISPIARNDTFEAIGNTVLRVGTNNSINDGESTSFAGNLISNDIGSLPADSIPGFQIDTVTNGVSVNGGTFNIFSDGSFNYVNDGTDTTLTTDSFTYKIRDVGFDGQINTADDLTSTGTVTITFALQGAAGSPAHRVWYVDSSAAPGGDGTSAKPFQNLTALNGVTGDGTTNDDLDKIGEYIYVENGGGVAATGPITLENGQQLIGDGAALTVAGVTLATAGTNSVLTAAGGTIVTLASGNTIAGLNIGNGTGTANGIAGTGIGTLTVNNVAIDTFGSALSLATGAFAGTGFTSVNSDSGTNNVSFTNVTGTVALGSGTLQGATGASLNMVSSGAANGLNVTYSGSIAQGGSGALVNVDGGTNGHTGTLTLTGALTATGGAGLVFNNADGTYNIAHDGTNSIGSVTLNNVVNGVSITNGSNGAFKFGASTQLQTASGTTFIVDGGNGNITFDGTITDDQGQLVRITNRSGGTIDFNGLVTDNFDGDGGINQAEGSIHLGTNTAGTVRFDGGINLSTGVNDALTSVNGAGSTATLVITDPAGAVVNKITTAAGQAIDIQNTTIGTGGLVFESINVNGATVGINLNTTGSTAGLSVLGTGAAGSGGTIQETGQGATFTSTSNVVLTNMMFTNANKTEGTVNNVDSAASNSSATAAINMSSVSTATFTGLNINGNGGAGGQQLAINGNVVSNFTLAGSTISGHGDEAGEGAIRFWNLTGNSSITNTTFSFANADTTAGENHIDIRNGSGTLTLGMSGNTFNTTRTSSSGSGGLSLTSGGTATVTANLSNNDFNGMKTSGVEVFARDTSILNVNITNGGTVGNHNVFDRQGGLSRAIGLNAEDTAQLNFNVTNNTISGSGGPIINMFSINDAQVMGRINGNTITGGGAGAAGSAIFVHAEDHSNAIVEILNNVILSNGQDPGISVTSVGDGPGPSPDNSTLDVVIAHNNITMTSNEASGGTVGIDVRAGANDGEVTKTAAYIHHNTVTTGGASDYGFLARIGSNDSFLYLQGSVAGGDNNARANSNWTTNSNTETGPGTTAISFDAGGSPAYTNPPGGSPYNGVVRSPSHPTAPILAEAPPPAPPVTPEDPADGVIAPVPAGDSNGGGTPAPVSSDPIVIDDGVLSQAELDLIVEAAIERWAGAGATAEQLAAMRSVSVSVSDLAGLTLGSSNPGTIVLDSDAAGWRWFVDSTPGDDSEYAGSGTQLAAVNQYGLAGTRIDLLTVITHELGHQIGLSDSYAAGDKDELMYGTIGAGERRLPGSDDLDHAADAPVTGAFAFAPVSLDTIPVGQTVIVEFRHVIDSVGTNRLVGAWTGQTTVDSDQTNPQSSNVEGGNIDGLTLGDLIFNDVNKNGVFDAGDSGLAGVTLRIYGDTNGNNVLDAGDLYVGYNELGGGAGYQQGIDTPAAPGNGTALTATSNASGIYSFANLAPGNYIVQIDASNFSAGGALAGYRGVFGGVDPDGSPDVDNDDNGIAGPAGSVVSNAVTLAYDSEPTAGAGNDTNNRLDFGFVLNSAPVANADAVTATEDTEAQYSTQLTGNDTDADLDTLTITGVSNFVNGSGSVTNGVVSFTPTANFNGTASFTYTISDGNGHTASATATVTVGAVNDPVTGTVPATATLNEDSVDFAVTGMSIADVDSALAPSGVYVVTLSATQGTLKLSTITGLTFSTGDGDGDSTMTFSGTLADINTALATAKYTPNANYNGAAQITLQVTDQFGAAVATGTGAATSDSDSIAVTVNSVNDAPSGTDDSAAVAAGVPYKFTVADLQDGFSDPADGNSFAGIKITELPLVGTLKLNGNAVSVNDVITLDDLTGELFTFDSPANAVGSASFKFAVKDNGGIANGGVEFDQSPDVFTLNIAPANVAPALDLDGPGGGSGFAASYTEGAAAAAISDLDVDITDGDSNDDIVSATITISNPETGDVLNVGSLPSTVTVDTNTGTMVKLVAAAGTPASDFELAIKAITFSSTSQDPTDKGTNTSRTINVVVNDGQADSNVAVATITVADDNADAPTGTTSTITAVEDAFRLIQASDLGFSDVDGTFASVTISAVSGGTLYVDSDGSAGANEPVVATLPATFTAQDLIDGKASFKAGPNAHGAGLGSITFTVTDDDGNVSESSNTLTVNVTPANDSPVLTTPGPVSATEQVAVALLPAGSVSDIDLDALNNGDGDYAGAQFSVNRNSAASTDDIFTLVAGPNFTIDGINLKTTGGQIFGQISANNPGLLVVTFNSSQAIATSALVDEVIQAVRYTNASNNPPASVVLAVGFTDGSPNVVQGGAGESHLDVNLLTVNIAGVNDAPVNSLGGTVTIAEDSVDQPLSGMSISDPDANPATDKIYVTFQVEGVVGGAGLIEIRRDVPGGITNDDVIAEGADTIQVFATLNQINATLAASNGLTYTPPANYNGNVTLKVYTYDQGKNGSDPGLSGDENGEEGIASRTITVTPVQDAAIARDDTVSTTENAVKTGNLFANNGSGADSDVENDPFFVTQVTVNGQNYAPGTVIDLPSGAKLTVNSDGTYSYDPNGKFTRLTDGTSGAVNTSATDTFTYTVTGGDTADVTMTVHGVAGPGDWLMGDAGDNTIVGTPESDFFFVSQGGDDNVSGLGSSDGFYFGAELTVDDVVDGGEGLDELALQGDYTGANALTMGDITSVEVLVLLPGNDARFGGAGGDYSYNITTANENVVGGGILYVDANRLRSNEHLTFNGSAETDGQFFFYGGRGNDTIVGGGQSDLFLFRGTGKFTAADTLNGGGGMDELTLRGDYAGANKVVFGATTITNIEAIVVVSGHDLRYGADLGDLSYDLTLNNSNVASGQLVIVDGGTLRAGESLMFDGSAEQDGGKFKIFGGQGDDVLRGGTGNDVIRGGLGQDTQTGGGGDDRFVYRSASDSTTDKREGIGDFNTGDIIDLSAIDAKTGVPGDDAFSFIGSGAFTKNAGEVRAFQFAGNIWEVQADIDGDGVADLDFFVTTDHNLVVTDFIL